MSENRLFVTRTRKVLKYRKENPVSHFFERFESGTIFCMWQINKLLSDFRLMQKVVLQIIQKNERMICISHE